MKTSADQGGCYPQRPKAKVDNTLRDLQNSSYPTKAEFNNRFIIHSKYFPVLKGAWPLLIFLLTKNNTTSSPGFLSQPVSILQWAALLTSFWCLGLIWQNFWSHWFNMTKVYKIWSTAASYGELCIRTYKDGMRVVLTNQKQGNILNE